MSADAPCKSDKLAHKPGRKNMFFADSKKNKVTFFSTKERVAVEILTMLNSSLCEEKNRDRLNRLSRRLSRKYSRHYLDNYWRYLFKNRMMSK